jgi:hypothetical protein
LLGSATGDHDDRRRVASDQLVIGATTCDQSVAESNWSISLSPIGHAKSLITDSLGALSAKINIAGVSGDLGGRLAA